MGVLETVTIGSLRLERFEAVLAPERYQAVRLAADRAGGARGPRGLERELDRARRGRR